MLENNIDSQIPKEGNILDLSGIATIPQSPPGFKSGFIHRHCNDLVYGIVQVSN